VHGVVDVYDAKKQSYELPRRESSPIESLSLENHLNTFQVILRTRGDVPMYTLRGYKFCGTFYGQGDIPVELQEVVISELPPASSVRLDVKFTQSDVPTSIRLDVMKPTGFSAHSLEWKPQPTLPFPKKRSDEAT
jgi:beta-galactosidase